MAQNPGLRIILFAVLLNALWGANYPAVKIALGGLTPWQAGAARFGVGALTILVWALITGRSLPIARGEFRQTLLVAVVFTVQIAIYNLGLNLTQAGRAAVINSSFPFTIAVLSHFFIPGDRLSRRKTAGLLLAFGGVTVVFAARQGPFAWEQLIGDSLMLLSAVLIGARHTLVARVVQRIDPIRIAFWQMVFSVPCYLAASALFDGARFYTPRFDLSVAGAVLYSGAVVSGFCFLMMYRLLKDYRPSHIGATGFVAPVAAVGWSVALLGEALTASLVTGVMLVGAGIYIVSRKR